MDSLDLWEELSKDFSVIPLTGKKPDEVGWNRWCEKKRPFKRHDFLGKNAGIACGPASNTIVLDVDDVDEFKKLAKEKGWIVPDTRQCRTGSGKPHLYYCYVNNGRKYGCTSFKVQKDGKKITVFDIRGCGGQVVAPGSIHPDTGEKYQWANSKPILHPPEWILNLLCPKEDLKPEPHPHCQCGWDGTIDGLPLTEDIKELIVNGAPITERSEAIMSVVNGLVYSGLTDDQIVAMMDQYAIGEKYREKRSGKTKWLNKHIAKARSFVLDRAEYRNEDFRWLLSNKGKHCTTVGNTGNMGNTRVTQTVTHRETGGVTPEVTHEASEKHECSSSGLGQLVESYISNFYGNFSTKDLSEYLKSHLSCDRLSRQVQVALSKCLARHVAAGRLERTVKGGYRIVDTSLDDLDDGYGEAEHKIKLPLSLNELVYIEPKEVIMVCGNTDGGKTCFAINVGLLNKEHTYKEEEKGSGGFGVYHFVSEMGGVSFRNKMLQVGTNAYEDYRKKVRVVRFKAESIADQIQPASINIIDYLEPANGDFREIVPTINSIFNKLTTGVAVICVQMRGEYPAGGAGVLWRPRLAVALLDVKERSCKLAKILKGKNNRSGRGVDSWEMDYWVHNRGTRFEELTQWEEPYNRMRKRYCRI